jgi:flavin reductase (DIM6/NTAB) family NADH-FMN oxidoreductase RutF
MYLSKSDLENTDRIKRLNLVNSVSGIKPGNLVGTISNSGQPNLAIISSVVHLGSNPAYLGFMLRPHQDVRRHTYENILENGAFTLNHIHADFVEKAHYTSAKFDKTVSEFDACGLTEEYLFGFPAPFVKESALKIGLLHVETVPVRSSNTLMIVGEIAHLILPDHAIDARGYIDLGSISDVGISGLNSYYGLKKIAEFPYARVDSLPDLN